MKKLIRLLLINWHYYSVDIINFDDINFLTGKTGAGKTTIVDAMQMVLLGDTNGQHFFNKAANDRSRRTLKGYLRGEYGDDGGTGFLSLRNGPFSSYIVCEFLDIEKNRYFSIGIVFDCNYTAQDESTFFILKESIPENHFIVDECPLTIKDLKVYLKRNYDKNLFEFCESGRTYQTKIKGLFGGLRDNYFSLLKKAVSFSPIVDIEEFITNNICDIKNNVDISDMKENLRQYKKLEREANQMKSRVAELEKISEACVALQDEKQKFELYQFLIDRSEFEQSLNQINTHKNDIKTAEDELSIIVTKQANLSVQVVEKSNQRDRLIEQRGKDDIYQNQQSLENERKIIDEKIQNLEKSIKDLVNRFHIYGLNWRNAVSDTQRLIEQINVIKNKDIIESELNVLSDILIEFMSGVEILLDIRIESISLLGSEQYQKLKEIGDSFKMALSNLGLMLGKFMKAKEQAFEECANRISDLNKNIKPYDKSVQILRNELKIRLSQKYKEDVEVDILADLLEIQSIRWVNSIEGYMFRQKQYILVSPIHYLDALKFYDQIKFEKGLYDIGLIDGEKVLNSNSVCQKDSLAEEITTNNPYARAYVNFLLGRVIKCDKVEELRKYERAVTDTGMLYQGFVVSQINPNLWQKPLIGKKAIQEQISTLEKEKPRLEEEYKLAKSVYDIFYGIKSIDTMNQNEAEIIAESFKNLRLFQSF